MQNSGISVNMIFEYYIHIHVFFIISHRKYYRYQWLKKMFITNPSVFLNICHNFVQSEHCKYKTCSSNYNLLTHFTVWPTESIKMYSRNLLTGRSPRHIVIQFVITLITFILLFRSNIQVWTGEHVWNRQDAGAATTCMCMKTVTSEIREKTACFISQI